MEMVPMVQLGLVGPLEELEELAASEEQVASEEPAASEALAASEVPVEVVE